MKQQMNRKALFIW